MKRFFVTLFAFTFAFALLSASAITATKEYVDAKDAATLQAAKDYADAHAGGVDTGEVGGIVSNVVTRQYVEDLGISGGGGAHGVDTNAVLDLIGPAIETNATVVSHTSQIAGLQDSVAAKRDLFDLDVYALTDDWTYSVVGNGTTNDLVNIGGYLMWVEDGWMADFGGPGWYNPNGPNFVSGDRDATRVAYRFRAEGPEDEDGNRKEYDFQVTAVRVRGPRTGSIATSSDLSAAISPTNAAFCAAVRDCPPPEDGEDPPWGEYATLGAAIAGILATLKLMVKKIKCGSLEISPQNGVADVSDFFANTNTLLTGVIASKTATVATSATSPASVTLADNDCKTVTMGTATALQIDFGAAKQNGGLRLCELVIADAPSTALTLSFPSGHAFHSSMATGKWYTTETGRNHFFFEETATNVWTVTRQVETSDTPTTTHTEGGAE